jgi:hypothetical protein
MTILLSLILLMCGLAAWKIAARRQRNGYLWFIVGIFLGPLAFIVAILPKGQRIESEGRKIALEEMDKKLR